MHTRQRRDFEFTQLVLSQSKIESVVSELEFEFTSCPSCYADEFPWHTSQRLAAEIDDDAEVYDDDDEEEEERG